MRPSHLALAALLAASPAIASQTIVAVPAAAPVAQDLLAADAATLPVTIACAACGDESPTVSLLWRGATAADPGTLRTVAARDWSAGEFVMAGEQGDVALQGVRVEDGWSLDVPVAELGLPFRVVTTMHGQVADHGAWWPQKDRRPVTVTMTKVADVLDAHPAWDPARSGECDVLIPKDVETPVVFVDAGQPRAWLFPTPGAESDPSAWTFQFVRPGASLLERMSVPVTAFDEGAAWALRVPLEATLASPARAVPAEAGHVAAGGQIAETRAVTLSGIGALSLGDCPRSVR